jgi:hypothetical protein
MPRPARQRAASERDRDFLNRDRRMASANAQNAGAKRAEWPPVPDLFDVITYFRSRGDSFALIASIGFWVGDSPTKALTARGLKLWYESELERRRAAKASIR